MSNDNTKQLKQAMESLLGTIPSGDKLALANKELAAKTREDMKKQRKFGVSGVTVVQSVDVVLANIQSPNIVN